MKRFLLKLSAILAIGAALPAYSQEFDLFAEPITLKEKPLQWVHHNIVNNIFARSALLGAITQWAPISATAKFYMWLAASLYDAAYWQPEEYTLIQKKNKNNGFDLLLNIDLNSPTFKKHGSGYLGTLGLLTYGYLRGYIKWIF